MKTELRNSLLLTLLLGFLFVSSIAQADPGNQYCVTPPFITAGIQPNLLLMMDNSASMFDLAYADKGTTTRTPTYCYDNTFSDANGNVYAGYFEPASYYDFNIASGAFEKIVSFPAAGSCTYRIDGKYCIAVDTATPKRVTKFSASGNYLNWMTSSKFDIQKKILTGGKYAGGNLIAESRGCVGRGFVKQPLSTNSGNYVEGGTNTAIPVTMQVRGENASYDEAAASQGGQTYINFYYGTTPFNVGICKTAIGHLTDGTSMSGPDKADILACIGSSGGDVDLSGKKKQIFNQSLQECWQYNKNSPPAMQGGDIYSNVPNFCTSVYNLREQDHGPLAFSPASDIQVGDADLLCGANYVGACYNGAKVLASLAQPPSSTVASLLDFLLPASADAASAAGSIQLGAATYSVAENGGTVTIPVTRVGGSGGKTTVDYATSNGTAIAGSDYTTKSGTLTWNNNNSTTQNIVITITNDATSEASETFSVTLSNITNSTFGTPTVAVVTILDDDGPPPAGDIAFSSAAYSISEGAPSVTITVTRSGGTPAVGVSYATSNGTALAGSHYTATSGTLSFGVNQTTATFSVPIVYNSVTGNKTFTITLSAATGGATLVAPTATTVTIVDDAGGGSVYLGSPAYYISEAVTPLTVTVKRTGGSSGAASVNYATSNGTALSGTNYTSTSGTLSWVNGDSADKTFTIPIINAASTVDKTFTITLSAAAGAVLGSPASATVNITYTGSAPPAGTWPSSWTGCAGGLCGDPCIKAQHEKYCAGVYSNPPVTDPTDAPGDTTSFGNLPAVLGDMAIGGQLGAPLKILSGSTVLDAIPVKLATAEPAGLIQTFASKIRTGLMSFNYTGSPSECGSASTVLCPSVCSNDATKTCGSFLDCCPAASECSCDAAVANVTNADGAKLLHPVGFGACSHDSSVTCTTNENCSALSTGSTCINAGGGTHGSGLVNQIDTLRATSWTPFSEAFYNAIGYYAYTAPTASRTALRINDASTSGQPLDFPADMNPSQFPCQQNYVLLISDGVSTADQRPGVMDLANIYKTPAGLAGGACTSYKGSSNLPILSWLAQNRNISNFNTSGSASTAAPAKMRDKITTYVVFNGQDDGVSGECNSNTMLSNTATKGGGRYYQANNPTQLEDGLRSAFEEISAKASSGTAASILSNSEGSGANILQAVFYPKKIFENATEVNWVGEMQNLWYFVDPLVNNSTIREDSDVDFKLNLVNDYVARFAFDTNSDRTMVQLYQDSDGNGTADTAVGGLIDPDNVKSLWRAGKLLWGRNINTAPRKLVTSINANDPAAPPSLIYFSSATYPGGSVTSNAATLAPFLNVADAATAGNLINWVHGLDTSTYRNRTVTIGGTSKPWLLGDIISSTPRVQSTVRLNTYNLPYPGGYNDKSYESFIGSNEYKNRGMVYVGGNDGMMHAFYLGILSVKASGFQKASISDPSSIGLGKEMWAYIPKNTLPYLKYMADPGYKHIYSIDGRTSIFDASIGYTDSGTCVRGTYDTCDKLKNSSVVDGSNNLSAAKNTWRTIVIGGMGIGGASAMTCTAGTNCVPTPITDPADGSKGLGYSSYFALDVTTPTSPTLLWEYNNPALGYSTTGPAIIRIGDPNKNGKWYAVFGSGPTGPINETTQQFLGNSDQNLKFFVVDVQTGVEVGIIDTGIANAFAGPLLGAAIDIDRGSPSTSGNYQDDAIYVGYTRKNTSVTPNDWTQGGVIRIVTKESAAVSDWAWSSVVDGIGPVTTAISRLQDKKNKNLWLYFGTGRYFFRDNMNMDDNTGSRALFGIKEPCYNTLTTPGNFLDKTCTDPISGSLVDQTSSISTTLSSSDPGWKIILDAAASGAGAERVVTDTVALTNGTVFFTSFKPTLDLCGYGGNSFLWGVKYDTGGQASGNSLTGKALIQLSTGEFKEVDLATAFTDKLNRRMATPMTGKPPSDAPPIISNSQNKPLKKILHTQER